MNETYLIPILLAAVMALVACSKDDKPATPPTPIEIPTAVSASPASMPASQPVTPASSTVAIPLVTHPAANTPDTPASATAKPLTGKVDMLVFDKLHRDCLMRGVTNKMTPDQCRENAWREAQK